MFENFSSNFVRNPLGIIALFIVLIYAMAGLVTTIGALEPGERIILVLFLAIFPLIVLAVFYMLVTRHPEKLYAPRDFRSDAAYQAATRRTKADLSMSGDPTSEIVKKWLGKNTNRDRANKWLGENGHTISATAVTVGKKNIGLREQMIEHFNIQEDIT